MATKIFYNDNRIIIDGHADTSEECQTITAMCDEMANSENFKTIVYEEGHAVFEQIDGGEGMMFEALQKQLNELAAYVKTIKSCKCDLEGGLADYLTKHEASKTYETIEAHLASIQLLQDAIDRINATLGDVDTSKGGVAEQLINQYILILEVKNIAEQALNLEKRISALETSPKVPLNYTAQQLNTLLAKVESL